MKTIDLNTSGLSERLWEILCILAGCRELDFEEQRKRSILTLFLMIGISIAFPFAVHHFSVGNLARALFLLAVGSVQLASILALRYIKRPRPILRLNVLLLGVYFLFLTQVGGSYGSRILWVLVYPLFAFFLLGKREGLLWSALFLLFTLFLFISPASLLGTYPYETEVKTRFLISYTILLLMSYIVEATRQRYMDDYIDYAAFLAVLAALRGVGQEKSEDELWQVFLSSMVEKYGFLMTWYGNYSDSQIVPEYSAGKVDRYLDDLVLDIAEPTTPDARCAMSMAVLGGQAFGYANLTKDQGFRKWRDYALELGYRSNLALPFDAEGQIDGGIMMYSGTPAAFPTERVERLLALTSEMSRVLKERRRIDKTEAALQQAYGELEIRVQKRTADLRRTNRELEVEIADRKRAEQALRNSEDNLRALLEAEPDGILIVDMETAQIVDANKSISELYGYSHEELCGMSAVDLSAEPEQSRDHIEAVAHQARGGPTAPVGHRNHRRKDGTVFPVEISHGFYEREGRQLICAVIRDTTERIQAESALRDSEERFRELAELLPETIFEMDSRGVLTFVNQAAFAQFGYSDEDFNEGLRGLDMLIPEHRQRAAGVIQEIMTGREMGLNEYTARRKNGSTFPVLIRSTPITQDGSPVGLRGIIIDISEKKYLETQLLQAQKMEAIGTLAGGIAHDFNNILMGIQACTSLIFMDAAPPPPYTEQLKGIEDYVSSAAELTKQLLGLARGGKYDVKPTDLNELMQKTAEMFARTHKEIQLHSDFQDELDNVEIDRNQIEQAVLNIFVNAWQAMPGGGNLFVKTENVHLDQSTAAAHELGSGKYVKLSIKDKGIGMDENTQQRIFDPFFTTKEMGRGTGLGLASAYGILKNHGGFIDVHSRKQEGTTFHIYLPAAKAVPESQKSEIVDKVVKKGQETILLVDDEKMILDVAKLLIEKLGYTILVARSGEEALKTFEQNKDKIELVILDLIMPEMSGAETYDELAEIAPNLKVLLASGYSIDDKAKDLLAKGCNGFIQKPFTLLEISRKIRSILDS